jgi:iron donor protein CyaY
MGAAQALDGVPARVSSLFDPEETMLDEKQFDMLAAATFDRIVEAFDEVDPDQVEAVPSSGVVKLDFQGRRRAWVVSTQRAVRQIWLAADQRAWHFAHRGQPDEQTWLEHKSGEELFATLGGLLEEHEGLTVSFD